jgi:hypothetical protein
MEQGSQRVQTRWNPGFMHAFPFGIHPYAWGKGIKLFVIM